MGERALIFPLHVDPGADRQQPSAMNQIQPGKLTMRPVNPLLQLHQLWTGKGGSTVKERDLCGCK